LGYNHSGYPTVSFRSYWNGEIKRRRWFVHRLVGAAFVANPDGKPQINHIDGNVKNNNAANLEWVTNKENSVHAQKIGLMRMAKPKIKKGRFGRTKRVSNIKTGGKYDSINQAAADLGISYNYLKKMLNGAKRNVTDLAYEGSYNDTRHIEPIFFNR